mgnify:CR=1 FL=1
MFIVMIWRIIFNKNSNNDSYIGDNNHSNIVNKISSINNNGNRGDNHDSYIVNKSSSNNNHSNI